MNSGYFPAGQCYSGVGTKAYTFIWGMVGENQVFDDSGSRCGTRSALVATGDNACA